MVVRRNSLGQSPGPDLTRPVVWLPGNRDYLSWAQTLHNTAIFGGTSAGKTSGPTAHILNDILRDPDKPGGLFLCVKSDERLRLENMINAAGRADDLVIINENNPYKVNALEYELRRQDPDKIDFSHLVDLLVLTSLMGEKFEAGSTSSSGKEDRFWIKSLKRLLARLMMLLYLSGKTVSVQNMQRILIDCFNEQELGNYFQIIGDMLSDIPQDADHAIDQYTVWRDRNYFLQCLDKAQSKEPKTQMDLKLQGIVEDYFLKQWPLLSDKTKSIVEESALGFFEPWNFSVLASHFSQEMSPEVDPALCFTEGKLIILEVPLKTFGLSSIYAMGILKKLFMLVVERRVIVEESNPRPCILFSDEYHYFATKDDIKFVSSCRSVMCGMIIITQSIEGLQRSFGQEASEVSVQSFLANFGTQIFCSSNSHSTNQHAAKLFGQALIQRHGSSFDSNERVSKSTSEQKDWIVPPEHFSTGLRTGGPGHYFLVDTIIHVAGKKWSTGENFLEVTFDQRGRQPSKWQKLFSFLITQLHKFFKSKPNDQSK